MMLRGNQRGIALFHAAHLLVAGARKELFLFYERVRGLLVNRRLQLLY